MPYSGLESNIIRRLISYVPVMTEITALLVQRREYREPNLLDEMEALATTAGYTILGQFDIVSPPSARFGIRTGKVEEITTWIEVNKPEFVLFSPPLQSSQIFRLMEQWKIEVRDRTQLILEIFDKHARTPQAKLQIEKARLKYELPFERYQIKIRNPDRPTQDQVGAGEDLLTKKLSEIKKRIALISTKLAKISDVQRLKKKKRSDEGFIEIAIAGYTNAGKSTLHKALTGSEVEIADKLFTTLSTKAAQLPVAGRQIIISDSVGFISDLPPPLMEAFNTTLMEISDADVLLLVIDGSDEIEEMMRKVYACLDTFGKIDASGIPIVAALNKIDLIDDDEVTLKRDYLQEEDLTVVPISAVTQSNLDVLVDTVLGELDPLTAYIIKLPLGNSGMSILSWLHEVGIVEAPQYNPDGIEVKVTLSLDIMQKLSQNVDVVSIEPLLKQ